MGLLGHKVYAYLKTLTIFEVLIKVTLKQTFCYCNIKRRGLFWITFWKFQPVDPVAFGHVVRQQSFQLHCQVMKKWKSKGLGLTISFKDTTPNDWNTSQ
jgi:hypothetical protein